jgi:hypothetical protein
LRIIEVEETKLMDVFQTKQAEGSANVYLDGSWAPNANQNTTATFSYN